MTNYSSTALSGPSISFGTDSTSAVSDVVVASVVGDTEATPVEAPVDGKVVDGVEQEDDNGGEEKVDRDDALATGSHDPEVETVGEHVFFEGPHDVDIDTAIADEAAASSVGEVEAPRVEAPVDGGEINLPIADDDVVAGAEILVNALQQLEVVPVAERELEGQVEKVAMVSGVDGRKEKAATTWNSNFELLCVYKAEHGGSCDVSRNEEGHQRLGRWVKWVCVVNSLLCCLLPFHFLMEFTSIRCPCNCTTAATSGEEDV